MPIALLAAGAMLLIGLCGSASAARSIGKGGSIQACYKVKGKAKGAMRVVPTGKKCKKGERKLAWRVAGVSGQPGAAGTGGGSGSATGQNGANGGSGGNGTNGSNGTNGNTATLESKIAGLNLKIDGLEKVLDGLNNGELSGVVDTVDGLTNGQLKGVVDTLDGVTKGELSGALGKLDGIGGGQLTDVVAGLPLLDSVCTQTQAVTEQTNKLGTALGGFSLNGVLTTLGGVLQTPTPPTPLGSIACG